MPIFLYMILQFFFGIYQVSDACCKYFKKGQPKAYYKDLKNYGLTVLMYFSIWFIVQTYLSQFFNPVINIYTLLLYMIFVPMSIGIYYLTISNKDYPEDLEKLIF